MSQSRPPSIWEIIFAPGVEEKLKLIQDLADEYLITEARPGDERSPEFVHEETVDGFHGLLALIEPYFRPEIHGAENIPEEGGALIVSNHGLMAMDTPFFVKKLRDLTGRLARPLGDRNMIRLPIWRDILLRMGVVEGHPEAAKALLEAGELTLVYPGGARESVKTREEKYRLIWDRAYGFVKVLLETQCPAIPCAAVGVDDVLAQVAEKNPFFGLFTGIKKFTMPVYTGLGALPFPAKLTYYVGEPIRFPYPPEAARDESIVRELQQLVMDRLQGLIDRGLVRRRGFVY